MLDSNAPAQPRRGMVMMSADAGESALDGSCRRQADR
jgi:hypothetical protein